MELLDKFSSKFDLSAELRDKLAGMVMRYKSLDAGGKAEFLGLAKDSLADQLGRLVAEKRAATRDLLWLVLAVAFVVLLFVFFGYKLYKSLSERERKREEKKKSKQMKKKK